MPCIAIMISMPAVFSSKNMPLCSFVKTRTLRPRRSGHGHVAQDNGGSYDAQPPRSRQVAFQPVDGPINDRIDDAYRAKYHGSPYLSPMIGTRARSATIKVVPRDTDA